MRFSDGGLPGVVLVHPEPQADGRGLFARTFCEREFAERGLHSRYPQCNVSWNRRRGTLRGLHYNAAPHGEVKLVRCTRGAILDVIVDLRRGSPSFTRWLAVRLDDESRAALYVPVGFAHGFLSLVDHTEVFYQMGGSFVAEAARGVRWDDPAFGIGWPFAPEVISDRDRTYPDFDPERCDA
jgi:dTDP-4-dehydrorhamnose 3,5-epimerase